MVTRFKEDFLNFIHWIQYSPSSGILNTLLSTFLLPLAHCAAALTIHSTKDFPELEVLLIRSIEQTFLVTLAVLVFNSSILVGTESRVQIFLLAITDYASSLCLYYALRLIPVSYVILFSALCPFFTALFSYLVLKEKCLWIDGVCGILGLIGVIIIVEPKTIFNENGRPSIIFNRNLTTQKEQMKHHIGCALGIIFGATKAFYLVLTQKWTRDSREDTDSHQITTLLYPSILGTIITPALMLCTVDKLQIPAPTFGKYSLFSVGILTTIGFFCITMALKTQNAIVVGGMRNVEIVWVFLLQYLCMGSIPTIWSIGGGLLLLLSGIIIAFRELIVECTCQSLRRANTSHPYTEFSDSCSD